MYNCIEIERVKICMVFYERETVFSKLLNEGKVSKQFTMFFAIF